MLAPIFYGQVEKGELKLIGRDRFKEYLYTLNGQQIELTLGKRAKKRTDKSNRYYWAYLHLLEQETGDDANSLHEYFKKEFLPPNIEYLKSINREVEIPKTTTKLLTIEFSEYIKKIEVLTGIPAPDPEEFK